MFLFCLFIITDKASAADPLKRGNLPQKKHHSNTDQTDLEIRYRALLGKHEFQKNEIHDLNEMISNERTVINKRNQSLEKIMTSHNVLSAKNEQLTAENTDLKKQVASLVLQNTQLKSQNSLYNKQKSCPISCQIL